MNTLKIGMLLEMIDRVTSPVRRMSRIFQGNMSEMAKSVRDVGKGMTDFGQSLSTRFTLPILGFGTAAVMTAANFEDYAAALETATGSQIKAMEAFEMLKNFTATTPYQLEGVIQSFITLKNRGLDPSESALRSYGNTASSMNKSLDQMIEAVADAATGEFERLKEFGIIASSQGSKVSFTFKGVTKTVRKNADEIQEYLKSIGDVNFAGAMEKKMSNFNGIISNFKDTVTNSLSEFGSKIIERLELKQFFSDLAVSIKNLTEWFLELSPGMQKFILLTALCIAALGPLLIIIGQFAIGLGWTITGLSKMGPLLTALAWIGRTVLLPTLMSLIGAFKMFAVALLTTPAGWFLLAITAIATAGYLIIENWNKVKAFFTDMWDGFKSKIKSVVDYVMPYINKLMGAISGVASGVGRVKDFIFGEDDESSTSATGSRWQVRGPRVNTATGISPFSRVDTGGTLNIRIDQDGQARVANANPNDRRQNYNVESGLIMGGL